MKSYPKQQGKLACMLRFMMHNLNDVSLTIKLFLCYVRPTLGYASPWHGTKSEDDALAMERIQAAVARRILRAPRHTPKSDLLAQLNWPALRWRREIASVCLLHQLLNNRPERLSDFLFPVCLIACFSHPKKAPATHFRSSTHHTVLFFVDYILLKTQMGNENR